MGAVLVPVFEPTRGELDVILESKGRGDEGVKLLAESSHSGRHQAAALPVRVFGNSDAIR